MTTPDPSHAVEKPAASPDPKAIQNNASAVGTQPPPVASPIPAKAKEHNIHVSPAVLDAAGKDGDALLQSLRTAPGGLTQAEAEERARTSGPDHGGGQILFDGKLVRKDGLFVPKALQKLNPAYLLAG